MNSASHQKGAALILVLWATLFLSLLLAGAMALMRTEARLINNDLAQLQVHQAMQGVLDYAVLDLIHAKRHTQSVFPFSYNLNGYRVTVDISPEMKKTDINLASEDQLAVLLSSYFENTEKAASVAAQIIDWRDTDDLSHINGAERKDYLQDSEGRRPGNRFFLALEELNQVLDMSSSILECLRPHITVVGARQRDQQSPSGYKVSSSPGARVTLRVSAAQEKSGVVAQKTDFTLRLRGDSRKSFEILKVKEVFEAEEKTNDCNSAIETG